MNNTGRKKSPRRKYRRLAAALAGAAVISSAMLPGLPLPKTQAAAVDLEKTTDSKPGSTENRPNISPLEAARQQAGKYGFDKVRDQFSLQRQTAREATVIIRTASGKVHRMELTRTKNSGWRIAGVHQIDRDTPRHGNSAVQKVKDNAYRFGFDARKDRFSLLTLNGAKATVQVRTTGQTFNVDLLRKSNGWEITTIRGIGNAQYPATYIPASMFSHTSLLPRPAANAGQSRILFESDQYTGWLWRENTHPANRTFGILLQNPHQNNTAGLYPETVLNAIKDVDFTKQFVLYTSLGTVPGQGYGIGIEKILQTGNNYTVTVRTTSPPAGQTKLEKTKGTDFVALDRTTLDLSAPVTITFTDTNGLTLSKYTLALRY